VRAKGAGGLPLPSGVKEEHLKQLKAGYSISIIYKDVRSQYIEETILFRNSPRLNRKRGDWDNLKQWTRLAYKNESK
jgi:hypothetical protein